MVKRNKRIAAIGILAGLLWATAPTAGAAEHGHSHDDHQHGAASELKLNNGKKWATDEALRRGMSGIRGQIAEHLHAGQGKSGPAQYDALAKKVNGQLSYIFQNCRLNKEADAVLHQILAQVIEGVEVLEGKQAGVARDAGVTKITHALETYPTYFDHPGWKPLPVKH